ncbi:unnamed protein product [Hydatigera taeniaeformis]|uniref:SCP domain-containing protein n=1 Tax=Hydatigena taeniaeformis TaxID=6205 RepID=A0A0R3X0I2_HYDTA|nr:unnamed protein product [Hydatigera taeniaeformis]
MNKCIFALILITHVASESLTEQERKALLHLHNTKRASVKPTSTNMLEMVYSRRLEKLADDWVVKCIYEHPNEEEYPEYRDLGQNLALSGGLSRNVVNMATEWWEEVKDYTYDTNTCAPGKACGHYTQMVWATSAEVGCAVQRCDNVKPDWPKPVFLMACQYKPALPSMKHTYFHIHNSLPGTMAKLICTLLLVSLVASEAPTEQERKDLLNFHNNKRATVNPSATNMLEMVYSAELEKLAIDWVAKCKFEHPDTSQYPQYSGIGQNLAVSGGSGRNLVAQATGWWNEVNDYNYGSNTCASGKVCGHYTQVVWATSEELGCAVKQCDGMMPGWGPPIYLLACQYKPPGNYMGVKPYTSGTSCSQCPAGTTCVNKLCSKGSSNPSTTTSSSTVTEMGQITLFAAIMIYPLV